MVFQEPLLFDTTVFNNVASGLKIRGMQKSEIRKRVMEHLERFGIGRLNDRSAKHFQVGRRRGRALRGPLLFNPKCFFWMSLLLH